MDTLPILEQIYRCQDLVRRLSFHPPGTKSIFSQSLSVDPALNPTRVKWLWQRMDALLPRRLYLGAMRCWLSSSQATFHAGDEVDVNMRRIDHAMLVKGTPRVLFHVDERLFLSPLHFWCWLRVLDYYLTASLNEDLLRAQEYYRRSVPDE